MDSNIGGKSPTNDTFELCAKVHIARSNDNAPAQLRAASVTATKLGMAERSAPFYSAVVPMTRASSLPPPKSGTRLRVLLVEDSPQVRRSMARALKSQFTVIEANDGEAAVELVRDGQARGETFDVVVTDLEMPKMNGKEALAAISKIAPELAANAIVVTGGAKDPQLAAWLKSLPARRVITKPADVETLRAAIYALVG